MLNLIKYIILYIIQALKKVSFITPVPGGVGPLTVSMLFKNLYRVWCRSNGLKLNIDE